VILRVILVPAVLAALVLAACGGSSSDESSIPGGADADAVQVIKDWADQLRAGHVEDASDFFTLPTTVQNGTPALILTQRQEVVQFNESLPCGARLTRAETHGRFTIATFVLTERPGAGECGAGVGETAQTAFVIHGGRISEWRRVVPTQQGAPTGTEPVI
jgi:hypothetical protein